MRRGSIIGPLILIVLGLLFLWSNLSGGFALLDLLATQWPWILVAWGLIRLGELFLWSQQGQPLPESGLSGGEWFLAVLLCVAGSGLYGSKAVIGDFGSFPAIAKGVRLFGESYDFSVTDQSIPADKNPRVLIENLRGEVIVSAEDIAEVRAGGRESLRAISEEDARQTWETRKLTIEKQGDLIVVRTNQEGLPGERQLRSYLQVKVPRNCILETRGRDLRFEATGVTGSVSLQADEADASVSAIKGGVNLRLNRSRDVRLRDIEGPADIKSSRGDNLSLEAMQGPVVVSGSFSGNVELRKLAGPIRMEDRRLDLRAVAIPGEIVANRGDLTGRGITGPLRIASESKDVDLDQFTGKLELDLARRDARIRQQGPKVFPMDVSVRRGKVTVLLPPNVPVQIDGSARKGEIANRTGRDLKEVTDEQGSRIQGGAATAPLIKIDAARIELEPVSEGPR